MVFRPPLPIPTTPHFNDDNKPTVQKAQWLTSIDNMFGSFNATPGGSVLGNASTTTGMAVPTTLTALLDAVFGTGRGSILVRGASTWTVLTLGSNGKVLTSNGTDLTYAAVASPGRVLLNSVLVGTTTASISDTTSFTNAYLSYEVVFENLVPVTNAVIFLFQVHSGGAFKNTGYLSSGVSTTGAAVAALSGTTAIPLCTAMSNVASLGLSGSLRISDPSTSTVHQIWGHASYATSSTATSSVFTAGYWNTAGAVDGFQIVTAGNIASGAVYVYGMT